MGAPAPPSSPSAPVQRTEAPAAALPAIASNDAKAPVASPGSAAPVPDAAKPPAAPRPEAAAKPETAKAATLAAASPKPATPPRTEAKQATQAKPESKPAARAVAESKSVPVAESKPAPAPESKPVVEAKAAPQAPAKAAPLDLKSLEQRLKDTSAIGLMTKLSLKNQVDDLIARFRDYHRGASKVALAELRHPYELLLMKVLSLLQDGDPALAQAINASRDAIWEVLADRDKFLQLA